MKRRGRQLLSHRHSYTNGCDELWLILLKDPPQAQEWFLLADDPLGYIYLKEITEEQLVKASNQCKRNGSILSFERVLPDATATKPWLLTFLESMRPVRATSI
jgi:hypothetical protein